MATICIGHDWAEDHHDLVVMNEAGDVLAADRVGEGVAGVAAAHALIGSHLDEDDTVVVGTETDHGLFIAALVAAGYEVYAVNPLAVDRYRDRHRVSGAKADASDARVLADLVRTDRHLHRVVAGDSELAEAVKILARAHKNLIWEQQRHANRLRASLREYFPQALVVFGDELAGRDALAVLAAAPEPAAARRLRPAAVEKILRRAGRRRTVAAAAGRIVEGLAGDQLEAPPMIADAYAATTRATVAVLQALAAEVTSLEEQLAQGFRKHPDAEIYLSQPGLGVILSARVLAEFGDDPDRYADARSRKNYAGTSPVTIASGKRRVVRARWARNDRLVDALERWAIGSLAKSPGARAYYDQHKANYGGSHARALRMLTNKLVANLDHCLRHCVLYDEKKAWPSQCAKAAA